MLAHDRASTLTRSRWAGIGAAVAVSLGAGGAGWFAHAAGVAAPASFVSITPCRLFDTRPAPDNVGDRSTPLDAGEDFARQVTGTNGNCTIPSTATGISYNLTVPTGINGFLTVYPADATRPLSSTINPVAGEGVKANGGIVGLSATGAITVYTLTGPLDAVLDITGYFLPATVAPLGVAAIASGQTVSGNFGVTGNYGKGLMNLSVSLPGKAPAPLLSSDVNFALDENVETIDDDAACTGTAAAPTAPAGKVCIYPYGGIDPTISSLQGNQAGNLGDQAFYISWIAPGFSRASSSPGRTPRRRQQRPAQRSACRPPGVSDNTPTSRFGLT